jgi:Cap4 dsDNA endonuclease
MCRLRSAASFILEMLRATGYLQLRIVLVFSARPKRCTSDAGSKMPTADVTTDQPEAPASNAGGVAARQGFKYQDHVAAHFVLAMIADARLKRVECETADDIVLAWQEDAAEFSEYVQVKTTENDKKWSQGEITKRANTKAKGPTSLVEKSLLCDTGAPNALFRIVSRRGVNKTLTCLTLPRDSQQRVTAAAELGTKLAKKFSTKSKNGNDLAFWTKRTVWQVAGELASLKATNQQYLANLAETFGTNPTHSHADAIYNDLLRMVDDAANASKITNATRRSSRVNRHWRGGRDICKTQRRRGSALLSPTVREGRRSFLSCISSPKMTFAGRLQALMLVTSRKNGVRCNWPTISSIGFLRSRSRRAIWSRCSI